MIEWLSMGGHGFYVWSSYGVMALAVVIEVVALGRRGRHVRQHVLEVIEEERA